MLFRFPNPDSHDYRHIHYTPGTDPAMIQGALYDAEEHLRAELAELAELAGNSGRQERSGGDRRRGRQLWRAG